MSLAIAGMRRGRLVGVALMLFCVPTATRAQATLPLTRADALLAQGRWTEAENAFYLQSESAPRDYVARAALGRFIAMKGAVRPGIVLIEEARQFGLDPAVARGLIAPLRAILDWRAATLEQKRDSTLAIRASRDTMALFRVAFQAGDPPRVSKESAPPTEIVLHEVVDRQVGLDSLAMPGSPIGIEVFEGLVPAVDVRGRTVTLSANPRAALAATGRRYPVLRTSRGVWVLVDDQRALRLATAIRELRPDWWQLDLPHGLLVVR